MNKKRKVIRAIAEFFRFLVGITFVFSGFVKAVDPAGFTYKIEDYLIAFHSPSLFSLSLPVAILLISFEFTCGAFLLMGIYRKQTSRLTFLFMMVFTPFTLWIALKNPVKDCGCFGDFLIIGNWQTFFKNVALLIGAIFLLIHHKQLHPLFTNRGQLAPAIFSFAFVVAFCLYNLTFLPVFDFRPFKIGAHIPSLMQIDTQQSDEYKHTFIYSKNGKEKEFTEENYPWNDSTWTFVEMKSELIKMADSPKIEDFSIRQMRFNPTLNTWEEHEDVTAQLLSDSTYLFLMVSPLPTKQSLKRAESFKPLCRYATENHIPFYTLTSSFTDSQNPVLPCSYGLTDERVLKTMIRANPGLLLIKNGTVIKKWNVRTLPSVEAVDRKIKNNQYTQKLIGKATVGITLKMSLILVLFVVPIIALKLYEQKHYKIKK